MNNETFDERWQHERAVRKLREAELEAHRTTEVPLTLEAVKERVNDILAS